MNTEAHTTRPFENVITGARRANRQEGRTRSWAGRLRGTAASVAVAAMVAVGGAGMLTTQEAASAGVTQHNYAILTPATQAQSSSTSPQNDKKSNEN